jgi:hypothetical protein
VAVAELSTWLDNNLGLGNEREKSGLKGGFQSALPINGLAHMSNTEFCNSHRGLQDVKSTDCFREAKLGQLLLGIRPIKHNH